uniref:Uncharacterized protein n=1 Tax=Anguilla anguilla TaxID=7936 RepID=A0A0E9WUA4_ANGAN
MYVVLEPAKEGKSTYANLAETCQIAADAVWSLKSGDYLRFLELTNET